MRSSKAHDNGAAPPGGRGATGAFAGVVSALALVQVLVIAAALAGVPLGRALSAVIAVAALGARLNLVGRELESQVILLAVVTATVAPTVFRALSPKLDLAREREARDAGPNGKLDPGLPSSAPMR